MLWIMLLKVWRNFVLVSSFACIIPDLHTFFMTVHIVNTCCLTAMKNVCWSGNWTIQISVYKIYRREEWQAENPRSNLSLFQETMNWVLIGHTVTNQCNNLVRILMPFYKIYFSTSRRWNSKLILKILKNTYILNSTGFSVIMNIRGYS